jgi:hypothetical protein
VAILVEDGILRDQLLAAVSQTLVYWSARHLLERRAFQPGGCAREIAGLKARRSRKRNGRATRMNRANYRKS